MMIRDRPSKRPGNPVTVSGQSHDLAKKTTCPTRPDPDGLILWYIGSGKVLWMMDGNCLLVGFDLANDTWYFDKASSPSAANNAVLAGKAHSWVLTGTRWIGGASALTQAAPTTLNPECVGR